MTGSLCVHLRVKGYRSWQLDMWPGQSHAAFCSELFWAKMKCYFMKANSNAGGYTSGIGHYKGISPSIGAALSSFNKGTSQKCVTRSHCCPWVCASGLGLSFGGDWTQPMANFISDVYAKPTWSSQPSGPLLLLSLSKMQCFLPASGSVCVPEWCICVVPSQLTALRDVCEKMAQGRKSPSVH